MKDEIRDFQIQRQQMQSRNGQYQRESYRWRPDQNQDESTIKDMKYAQHMATMNGKLEISFSEAKNTSKFTDDVISVNEFLAVLSKDCRVEKQEEGAFLTQARTTKAQRAYIKQKLKNYPDLQSTLLG